MIQTCKTCNNRKIYVKLRQLCRKCYNHEWRLKNKEKIKEFNELRRKKYSKDIDLIRTKTDE